MGENPFKRFSCEFPRKNAREGEENLFKRFLPVKNLFKRFSFEFPREKTPVKGEAEQSRSQGKIQRMDEIKSHSDDPVEPWLGSKLRPVDLDADNKTIIGLIVCPACGGRGEYDTTTFGATMAIYAVAPAECLLCGHLIEPQT